MADSQRKTDNLWDEDYTNISSDIYYKPVYVGNYEIVTVSSTVPLTSQNFANLFALGGQQSSGASTGDNGVYSGRPVAVRPVDGYITIAYRNANGVNPQDYHTMVNEGRTSHTYAPYWQHSLRKLTTDTAPVENPLYSDGTAITSYTIKGNTVQNGTPTPSAPVDVNGVGVRTENLTTVYNPNTSSSGGLNFEAIGDKLRIYGTASTYVQCINTNDIILPSGTYTFSISSSIGNTGFYAQFRSVDGTTTYATITNATTITFNEATTGRIRVIISATESKPYATDEVISIMINEGSTALPYEPYGYKIPISSGQQTTNIYLGSTQTVRQIKKIDLSTLNWNWNASIKLYTTSDLTDIVYTSSNQQLGAGLCEYYKMHIGAGMGNALADGCLAIDISIISVHSETQTPPHGYFYYALRQAETGIVNEPLMKIGNYVDTLSNAASIPTTEGANSITVDTTVQPSEFTATWTGWHDAEVKEKSENLFDIESATDSAYINSLGEITYNDAWSDTGTECKSCDKPHSIKE